MDTNDTTKDLYRLNLAISKELVKKAKIQAAREGKSLTSFISDSISSKIPKSTETIAQMKPTE